MLEIKLNIPGKSGSRRERADYQIETIEVKPINPKFMMFHNRDYWHLKI